MVHRVVKCILLATLVFALLLSEYGFGFSLCNNTLAQGFSKENKWNYPSVKPFYNPLDKTYEYNYAKNPFKNKYLSNGLLVVVRDHPSCGVVAAEFIIKVGAMEEMKTKAGITEVIQRMLLRSRGEDGYTLQEYIEEAGGFISAQAGNDYARISLTTTSDRFPKDITRISSVLKSPSFNERDLKDVKEEIIRDITQNKSAYGGLLEIFLKEFYRYHPYRIPVYGYENTVKRFSVQDIENFYHKYYCGNRITLGISGDITVYDAMKLAEKHLGDLPSHTFDVVDIPWDPKKKEKRLYLVSNSNLAWLFVGFPAPSVKSTDYPAMLMLTSFLGEGLSSRLFIELREKEGLAYELSAHYPPLEGPSYMVVYVVTNQRGLYRCRRKLFDIINSIKKKGISKQDLILTRRKVLGKILLDNENLNGEAFYSAFYSAMGLGPSYTDILQEKIKDVTSEDIKRVARKYLENYTLLMVESSPKAFEDD